MNKYGKNVSEQVRGLVNYRVWCRVWYQTRSRVYGIVRSQIDFRISEPICDRIWDLLKDLQ
jgi:hypothetical protein